MTVPLPAWLFRLIFGRKLADIDKRAKITGSASFTRTDVFGPIEIEMTYSAVNHKAREK